MPQTSPVYIRQAAAVSPVTTPVSEVHQPTPEEQRLQAAYESEQRAMAAPTGIDSGFGAVATGAASTASYQLASAQQTIPLTRPGTSSTPDEQKSSLSPQESFVKSARNSAPDDYLKSTRTGPISPYEIKAGWEIPAVMEQGLNSDLPGEVKAPSRPTSMTVQRVNTC